MRVRLTWFAFLAICAFLINCKYGQSNDAYWSNLQDSFATKNLKTFEITEKLEKTYRVFTLIKNSAIDSICAGKVYLYSWEGTQDGLSKFTVFVDEDEHGKGIIYCVFNDKNELLSHMQLASKSGEGGILYETRSKYIGSDTLLTTSAATTSWDFSKIESGIPVKLKRPKGDSAFYHVTLSAEGKWTEKKISEKKELNLIDPTQ